MSTTVHAYVLDPLERAGFTFVQQFVAILLATGSAAAVTYQAWGKAADVAAFAAVVSVLTSVATFALPALPAWADLLARVGKTGVQSLLGVLAADQFSPGIVHADWAAALGAAVPVAFFALLKGVAALVAPWSSGASLLPAVGGAPAISAVADAGPADQR